MNREGPRPKRYLIIAVVIAMPFLAYLIYLAIPFLVAGWYTVIVGTGMVIDSPRTLTLTPEPPKYFSMDLEIDLRSEIYRLHHVWHCEHTKVFSMGDGQWHLDWRSSARRVVKILPNRSALFFTPPGGCDIADGKKQFPNIGLIDDIDNLKTLQVYPGSDSARSFVGSNVVAEGTTHVLDKSTPDSVATPDEERIRLHLTENVYKYKGLVAYKKTEAEWRTLSNIDSEQFRKVDTIITSWELYHHVWFERLPQSPNKTNRGYSASAKSRRILNAIQDKAEKNLWIVDNTIPETNWIFYGLDNGLPEMVSNSKVLSVNYKGKLIEANGHPNLEIYDPADKSIAFLTVSYLGWD